MSTFISYPTMFKLESPDMVNDIGRKLQCVACAQLLDWRVYRVAPLKLDAECNSCHVKAADFWKGKPHKESKTDA